MDTPAYYECFSIHVPARIRKIRNMRVSRHVGSRVRGNRTGNRSGAKTRAAKARKQPKIRVSTSALIFNRKGP